MHGTKAWPSGSSSTDESGSDGSDGGMQTPEALTPSKYELNGLVRSPPAAVESDSQDGQSEGETTIHARAYQIEMFEESLKRNIIVAVRLFLQGRMWIGRRSMFSDYLL